LFLCTLFGYATVDAYGAAPIVNQAPERNSSVESADETESNNPGLAALFYQLQVLQEELAIVRGMLEEQIYRVDRLTREQNRRYTDIDRRFRELRAIDVATEPHDETDIPPLPPVIDPTGTERGSYESAYALTSERRFDDAIVAFDQFMLITRTGSGLPTHFIGWGNYITPLTI